MSPPDLPTAAPGVAVPPHLAAQLDVWSEDVKSFVNDLVVALPRPPALPLSDYQVELAEYVAGRRRGRPRPTELDRVALDAIKQYNTQAVKHVVIAGVFTPREAIAEVEDIRGKQACWPEWHQVVAQLIEAANADRAEVLTARRGERHKSRRRAKR